MISRAKKYVAVLLAFVCVCMIFSPQTAYAAEDSSQHETVKVGFFDFGDPEPEPGGRAQPNCTAL